jgi:hypothetical protein
MDPEKEIPIFVKIDEYKDILDTINMIKTKIREAKETLDEIHEIKTKEDNEIDQWKMNIEEVERRMLFIDKTLFGE